MKLTVPAGVWKPILPLDSPPIIGPDAVHGRAKRSPSDPIPPKVFYSLVASASVGILAVFLVVFALGFSALQEQRSQHQLYASFRGLLAPASPVGARIGGLIPAGQPVAVMNAPAAGLHRAMVVEGTTSGELLKGPGHLRDSPLPGQAGQSVILGKSVTAGAPFAHLKRLQPGDTITVTTGQSTFTFRVIDQRTGGDPIPQLTSGASLLTLVTATGSGFLGHLAPNHVTYVDAALQGAAAPAPTDPNTGKLLVHPIAVPSSELPGHGDPNSWPYLIFWLQALIVVGVGAVWSWTRWGRRQTWLVAGPVVLAVMWGISTEALRLLPNVV